ncbi:DUF115 domain-containing protein [Acetatifactor muris]|uniref:6-hydroxymethylpterin diphosphokinase MptE-like domain-containing protein n=1 Tax=Acetatifactor muris TaxID=879566 RepID=A0A2K4ZAP9_9FIRM|nr:6-hydroxymethylpterin diphosphokinase MptE-like protein [Acetatifactor muris]MCR2048730.1 DUF115 domain-containing protein [Acetatifactor muris]SOY27523.1 hypothetical protein AMURIS_00227 [Acetatifactor muris]
MRNYHKTDELIGAVQSLRGNKLYIAGAGKYGEFLGQFFDKHKIAWEGYADKRKSIQKLNGKPVYTYDKLDVDGYYVVSTCNYKDEIEEELRNAGIRPERIISYDNPEVIYELYADWIDWRKYTKRLKKFYGRHKGKRCFIIGNGPSLSLQDLEKLKQEISFGSNSIYALYAHTAWRPTYYCAWDPVFCKEMMSEKKSMFRLMEGCEATFTSLFNDAIQYRDDADMEKLYYMRTMHEIANNGLPKFSEDCAECVYTSGTITYGMLQLAVYMGFRQIYLLGMDFSYSHERYADSTIVVKNTMNHLDIIEKVQERYYKPLTEHYGVQYMADIDLQRSGYEVAKKYADTHEINIYNATRGGKLEVFKRVSFDGLFDGIFSQKEGKQ